MANSSTASNVLSGLHVLLIEDQTLIALDTEMMLRDLGAESVETFTTAKAALAYIATKHIDAAVLDINLGSTSSFAVAEALAASGVPFIFTTGYGEDATLPAQFTGIQIVAKPYTLETVGNALLACLCDPTAD
jgi:CheY-like chemotaxis protein